MRNWKEPPVDPSKRLINKSLELQILLNCNWSCHACDQHSNMPALPFVRRATMSMRQIGHFCREMQQANAYLGRIRIMGGEATIHPRFGDIVALLHDQLVRTNHVGGLEVITNGSHPEKIEPVKPLLIKVRVSGEEAKEKHHVANLAATPNSLGYQGKMCNAPWHCGFSLNHYGYFPCSAGAGIARMRDWMRWQRLELPTEGVHKTWPDLQELCNFCYHGLRPEDQVRCGTKLVQLNVPSAETWEHLGQWLNGKQPEFAVYGE